MTEIVSENLRREAIQNELKHDGNRAEKLRQGIIDNGGINEEEAKDLHVSIEALRAKYGLTTDAEPDDFVGSGRLAVESVDEVWRTITSQFGKY